ncbi:solute carrier family 66 member 2 isoform X1 [Rhipicephalus sanguineus]|uniref:solute carrier family 66 member 2 isoform X1 n=1 Tax=Rhipicephalus sanguineus TaxID=34632 RepID=UPI001893322F|nr:solute carrier family 66 member 2 isoform X1 [Rhipicephalus sanguineus]
MTSVTTAGLFGAVQSLSETVFMASISQWLSWGASVAMIFGGVVPYIPQYREIKKTRNTDGFSTWVCLALLVANTLRILFWFGRPFELPLLVQSIVMSASMFLMLRLCVKTRSVSTIVPQPRHTFAENASENPAYLQMVDVANRDLTLWDSPWRHFWAWTDFLSYVEFMATFALCSGALLYLLLDVELVVEAIGFVALLTEALLGLPQFWRNLRNQSTHGMSNQMVLMWTMGDVFKTVYFIMRSAPFQFWVCGSLQVSLDVAILIQVAWYKYKPASSKVPKHSSHIS